MKAIIASSKSQFRHENERFTRNIVEICALGSVRNYAQNNKGSISMTFAAAFLVLALASGIVFDYSRGVSSKMELQASLDSALFTAARQDDEDDAREAFDHQLALTTGIADLDHRVKSFDYDSATGIVRASLSSDVNTTLMKIFNVDDIEVNASAAVKIHEAKKVEVALLVDISTSMNIDGPEKFEEVRTAIAALLTDFSNVDDDTIWTSLVPFGTRVGIVDRVFDNGIGTNNNALDLDWFESFSTDNPAQTHNDVAMCPELRTDSSLWTDATPEDGAFPIWYGRYGDTIWTEMDQPCHEITMTPLTNNYTNLLEKAVALEAIDDGTRIDIGILWAWRALSPKWRGLWWTSDNLVLPRNTSDAHKVIIVLTDGENWRDTDFENNRTFYDADTLNERTLDICEDIRDAGITIFYVDYLNPRGTIGALKDCATSNDHYFSAGYTVSLTDAFEKIFEELIDQYALAE